MTRLSAAMLVGLSATAVCATAGRLDLHAASLSAPSDIVQSVTGSAEVDLREQTGADLQYSVIINAYEDLDSDFLGTVVTRVARGDVGSAMIFSRVTGIVVSGNSAWISSVVTHSTNENIASIGEALITYVRDFGDTGDVLHQEPVRNLSVAMFDADGDGDVDCHDRPALYPSTVDAGNIVIK